MPLASRTPILALLVALVALLVPAGASAAVDAGSESAFLTSIDRERAARGLPALRRAADLQAVARRHAARMADRGALYHNPQLGSEVSGWSKLGENVGRGPDAGAVHDSFMASPSHRDNVVSAAFVEVGVGVERRGDVLWVTQVFRVPESQPAAQPTPEPAPQPQPTATATAPPAPSSIPAPPPAPTAPPAPAPAPTREHADLVGTASATAITPAPAPHTLDRLTVTLAGIDAEDEGIAVAVAIGLD